jgi:anti-anti-sigma factor
MLEMRRIDGLPVAVLPPDLDVANAKTLGDELAASVTSASPCLIIDAAATRYLDSAGIEMLFDLDQRLRQRRMRLVLAVPADSHIRRLLDIAQVEKLVPIFASVEEAIEHCTAFDAD